ncbi:MAG TPA: type VI secretion system lipoprotein TssJ [Myxococcaceae bacterium]|nr:type VI secretion system lipoprotein TssJ [Myxococcaceae bacterium]
MVTRGPGLRGATLFLALVLSGAMGCVTTPPPSSGPCDTPPPFHLTLESSWKLNPGQDGRSLHTIVQVLQVQGISRLQAAAASPDVFHRTEEVLGDELLGAPEELPVGPADKTTRWFPRDPKARYVVVIGRFLEAPAGTHWWSAYELRPSYTPRCLESTGPDQARVPGTGDDQARFYLEGYGIAPHTQPARRVSSDPASPAAATP